MLGLGDKILHLVIQNQKRGNIENSQTKYPFIQLTLAATTLFALSLAWIFHSSRCSKNSILMLWCNKTANYNVPFIQFNLVLHLCFWDFWSLRKGKKLDTNPSNVSSNIRLFIHFSLLETLKTPYHPKWIVLVTSDRKIDSNFGKWRPIRIIHSTHEPQPNILNASFNNDKKR